ncbi:MAG TPA: carboxypeptidase-like regulatory domain-containing protein, partial [Streptosporangiaceae bacterium]
MNNTLRGTRRVAAGLIAALTALSASVAAATAASASTTSGAGTSVHTSASAHAGAAAAVSRRAQRPLSLAKIAMLEQRAKIAAHARASRQGAITGRVVGFDSRPVTGACVTAVGRAGSVTAAAAPDGTFRLADLAAGSYALEYRDCSAAGRNLTSASGYLTTWSGGTSTQISAARVQVTAGQIRHVPVMMLRPANPAAAIAAGQASFRRELAANGRTVSTATAAKTGKISGKGTGKGKRLSGVCVEVSPASGNGVGFGAVTGRRGTYTVQHITPGRYYVIFAGLDCGSRANWLQQVYRNDNRPFADFDGSGTVVRVRAGHKITGINANLRL